MKSVVIKESSIEGKGVFAKRDIRKGEIVTVLKGVRRKRHSFKELEKARHWIQIDVSTWLETKMGRFFNHSCNPNVAIIGREVIALRDIAKGEEFFFDYNTTEWDECKICQWNFECKCGSTFCMGKIKGYRHLPDSVKEKYKKQGFVANYLLKLDRGLGEKGNRTRFSPTTSHEEKLEGSVGE